MVIIMKFIIFFIYTPLQEDVCPQFSATFLSKKNLQNS